jgi:hypothetical protein
MSKGGKKMGVSMVLGKFIETFGVVSLMVDTGLAKKYR